MTTLVHASCRCCMRLTGSLTVLALSLTTPGRPKLGAALVLLFLFCCHRQSCTHKSDMLMTPSTFAFTGQTDMGTLMQVVSRQILIHLMNLMPLAAIQVWQGLEAKHWQDGRAWLTAWAELYLPTSVVILPI